MEEQNSFKKRLGYLSFAIVLDAAANALMVDSNVGSAVWMASGVNISHLINVSYGNTLFVYAVLVTIANQILLRKFDRKIFISNLLFALPFSYLMGFFSNLYLPLHFEQMHIVVRIIIDVIGLIGVSVATSIYQRCNLVQHPNDELAYIIRFKYVHGSAGWGQFLSYTPPVTIMIVCFILSGKLLAVGLGTVFGNLYSRNLIGISDKIFVPSLKHHYNF
jgi:Predicted membrane protein